VALSLSLSLSLPSHSAGKRKRNRLLITRGGGLRVEREREGGSTAFVKKKTDERERSGERRVRESQVSSIGELFVRADVRLRAPTYSRSAIQV
jgi:hypothetical protein